MTDEHTPDETLRRTVWRMEITDVLHAYAYHFDRGEVDLLGALFTDDAVVDYGPEMTVIEGREALVDVIAQGQIDVFEATSHHVSNVTVTVTSDTAASAVAYVYAWHRYRDGSPDGYLWGQYHTELRRSDRGWLISRLTLRAAGLVDFHREVMHPIRPASG